MNANINDTNFGLMLDETMLSYNFGQDHVMNINRLFPAYHLLKEIYVDGEYDNFIAIDTQPLDKTYLYKAHKKEYVAKVEELSERGEGVDWNYGLGTGDCPVWEGMAEVSEFVVASTVTAAEKVYNGEINFGFVLMGGLHHARAAKASGFCYYNDINVAVHRLKALDPDIRILYLDTDLHHGDGTQFEFYDDPNILTISFHESGNYLYPGSGFPREIGKGEGKGYSVNLPFMPYTWDDTYLEAFNEVVPPLFEQYDPDLVIWQSGADGHENDPLGHLRLTSNTYGELGKRVRQLAEEHLNELKVLSMGGGGYDPYSNARSWSHMIAGFTGVELPNIASREWVETCKSQGITVRDDIHEEKTGAIEIDKESIMDGNQRYMEDLKEEISPYFSI